MLPVFVAPSGKSTTIMVYVVGSSPTKDVIVPRAFIPNSYFLTKHVNASIDGI
jgi:hypothetical protein